MRKRALVSYSSIMWRSRTEIDTTWPGHHLLSSGQYTCSHLPCSVPLHQDPTLSSPTRTHIRQP